MPRSTRNNSKLTNKRGRDASPDDSPSFRSRRRRTSPTPSPSCSSQAKSSSPASLNSSTDQSKGNRRKSISRTKAIKTPSPQHLLPTKRRRVASGASPSAADAYEPSTQVSEVRTRSKKNLNSPLSSRNTPKNDKKSDQLEPPKGRRLRTSESAFNDALTSNVSVLITKEVLNDRSGIDCYRVVDNTSSDSSDVFTLTAVASQSTGKLELPTSSEETSPVGDSGKIDCAPSASQNLPRSVRPRSNVKLNEKKIECISYAPKLPVLDQKDSTTSILNPRKRAVQANEQLSHSGASSTPAKRISLSSSSRVSLYSSHPSSIVSSVRPKKRGASDLFEAVDEVKLPRSASLRPCSNLPKRKSKLEIESDERRSLVKKISLYDLSDLASFSNTLSDWPAHDADSSFSSLTSLNFRRIWSNARQTFLPSPSNSQRSIAHLTVSPSLEETGHLVNGSSSPTLPNGPLPDHSGIQNLPETCDSSPSFVVALLSLSGLVEGCQNEFDQLMRELAFISTDLVCLQDVEAGLTRPGGRLLSMLAEHGYSARFVLTPCDTSVRTSIDHQSSAVARATILLYRTDVFTELGYRIRPVDKIAKSVIRSSAYPATWRRSLLASLSPSLNSTSVHNITRGQIPDDRNISNTGATDEADCTFNETDSDSDMSESPGTLPRPASRGPRLLVSFLRHRQSRCLLLFACLSCQSTETQVQVPSSSSFSGVGTTTAISPLLTQGATHLTNGAGNCLITPQSTSNSTSMPNMALATRGRRQANQRLATETSSNIEASLDNSSAISEATSLFDIEDEALPDEWQPPVGSAIIQPDLTALHAAGALWTLSKIWQELSDSLSLVNGSKSAELPINGEATGNSLSPGYGLDSTLFRWVLCGQLNAGPRSPAYQICRDGYPTDDSLARLRTVRTLSIASSPPPGINAPLDILAGFDSIDKTSENFFNAHRSSPNNAKPFVSTKKALIDLIWPAFQHPCHDVLSCHVACLGREPPFTRISRKPISDTQHTYHHRTLPLSFASLRDSDGPPMCSDYIWCSGDGLRPESVLLPACRRILADLISASNPPPIGMALASRISFRRIPHHELSSALI